MEETAILPDLQSAVLCEDVRCEINGMQTLVGVINVIPAPTLPINCMRLCIWSPGARLGKIPAEIADYRH
jgi:hypothetical protein